MTTEDNPSLWGFGTTKTFKIPVEHLDFKYIEKCSNVKHLEKILCELRSGEEGYYPELTELCEKRLQKLAPQSRALRKDKPAATASSFTAEEWEKIDGDIKSWVSEIKKEEGKIQCTDAETVPAPRGDPLPPVRGARNSLCDRKEKHTKSKPAKKKIPRDYAEWDKFDVEKECSKLDEDYKEKTVINNKLHLSKIETSIDITGLTEKERDVLATREREKGNEAFHSGDYEEAVMYYTRSLSALPSVAAYSNRAQAQLKLENWNSAFLDCEKVLELEPGNIKGLLRRATTYKHQNKLLEAKEDLNKVLEAKPDDALAKKILAEVERELKSSGPVSKTQTKGKRLAIQEVENSEDEDGKDRKKQEEGSGDQKPDGPTHAQASKAAQPARTMGNLQKRPAGPSAGERPGARGARRKEARGGPQGQAPPAPRPPPPAAPAADPAADPAGLRGQGNALFASGQFSEAAARYAAAIAQLEPAGSGVAEELSTLYSNRAACRLKEGDCRGCVHDCCRALELRPFSVKPLLRRALAYEALERYRDAYVDYKTVLQVDCGIQTASDSVNRITRILIDLDGSGWREKLPPIPVVPTSAQVRAWQPVPAPSPDQAAKSHSPCSGSGPDENLFKTLKEEGNQCVKDKNYTDAISKYSACLKINDKECAIYTNRALCYLKLGRCVEAEQDCSRALQLEAANVKALYRRALAHKGLQNYQQSLNDLRQVLQLDASIAEARTELEEVTGLLQAAAVPAPSGKDKERRKIEIQEVEEPEEDPGSAPEGGKSPRPSGTLEPLPVTTPSNAYEFGQLLSAIGARGDTDACARLLSTTDPERLPALLSNKLEGDTFLLLVQALRNGLLSEDPSLVYRHLFYLSRVERFRMVLTLISKAQKEQIEQLFEDLMAKPNTHFSLEEVQALSLQYDCPPSPRTPASQSL
ncbi:sperm-associated antigen 1 [Sorex araneus]|uniref:sperm-associated antigen 1 n=1 Tax=Sorex araneus TaxID=42254 RepID=UPI0024335050|nr:sperm-associated antigen 1 [Sorex araneus]